MFFCTWFVTYFTLPYKKKRDLKQDLKVFFPHNCVTRRTFCHNPIGMHAWWNVFHAKKHVGLPLNFEHEKMSAYLILTWCTSPHSVRKRRRGKNMKIATSNQRVAKIGGNLYAGRQEFKLNLYHFSSFILGFVIFVPMAVWLGSVKNSCLGFHHEAYRARKKRFRGFSCTYKDYRMLN